MTLLSAIYHTVGKNDEKRPTDYATQVKTYIEDHFDQNLSLKSLSDHFHLNASYLSQLFRQRCGKCLTEYIESVRMEKSKNWLETTDMTVAETALRTGYTDANYFSKVFKKNTGISPTDYQREHSRKGAHSHRTADA
jgi:YesN/AraC family two-component response regulator